MRTALISCIYAFFICVTICAGAILEAPAPAVRHQEVLGSGSQSAILGIIRKPQSRAVTGPCRMARAQGVKPADFSFANSYPLNRLLTPNGDRKNDTFVFRCYTAKDSAVTGKIFSIAGRKVAEMVIITNISTPPFYKDLEWDPNFGGNRVRGGIYIYQIEVESRAYTGTVVVIR